MRREEIAYNSQTWVPTDVCCREMNSCGRYLNWLPSPIICALTSPQQFVAWSGVKKPSASPSACLSLINSNAVGKTSLRQQQNYFHITRHLRPNRCLNNAEQMSPRLPQIQPMDAALLAAVKSRGDDYHPVVSTSPLLYLAHPSSQPLRRPLTLTLPCPPNPEKKRRTREQRDEQDHRTRPISASPPWDQPAPHRRRWVNWGLFVFDVFEDLEESSSSNGMKNVCHH